MPEFIERDVRRMRGSSSSEQATLLVGCSGDRDELADDIRSIGGEVHDHVGRTTLRVSVPKSDIDRLCEIDAVLSIEPDANDVTTQGDENFGHQTDSMT